MSRNLALQTTKVNADKAQPLLILVQRKKGYACRTGRRFLLISGRVQPIYMV